MPIMYLAALLGRLGFIIALTWPLAQCSPPQNSEDPWVDEQFVEFEDDEDIALRRKGPLSPKSTDSNKLTPPVPDIYRTQNRTDDFETFFQAYPVSPITPPGIEDRQRVLNPDRDKMLKYGIESYLPTVPMDPTKPMPKDYIGVERWNRLSAIPIDTESQSKMDTRKPAPVRDEFDEANVENEKTKRLIRKDGTEDALNPPDDNYRFDVSDEGPLLDRTIQKDERITRFDLGPKASFAMNFLDSLRGASFAGGFHALYIHNKYVVLDGWTGYRRIVTGVGGENREVFTLHNWATGIEIGPMLLRRQYRHLRFGVGGEFNFNFLTRHDLAGGSFEKFSNVHLFNVTSGLTWQDEGWAVFMRYNLGLRSISDEHTGLLHIAELGLIIYVL